MTVWFVSRHPGARKWAQQQGLAVDRWCDHLAMEQIAPGDRVIGTLPVPLVAALGEIGASYWHLVVELPAGLRGRELSCADLERLGAHLQRYEATTGRDTG